MIIAEDVKKPLRFAIIGCGKISYRHASILRNDMVNNACLAAVSDIDLDKASLFGRKYTIPYYDDYHNMMEKEDIDVVVVLTDSGSHAEHSIQLASYGKHILVEKPMALTLDDADRMIAACDQNGCKLFVVKQNRFNLPIIKLKQAIEEGRFGKLVLGAIRLRWCRDQDYYDQADWRGTWARDGGVLANQAIHHIDLLDWLMSDVESVFARGSTNLVNIEAENSAVATLKFRNGALGVIEATTATRPKDMEGSISVLGEYGSVEIGGFAANELTYWKFNQETDFDKDVMENHAKNPDHPYGFAHQSYYEHVVDCIVNGNKQLIDGIEGKKSLEIITAMYESIETGQEVSLRFIPKKCKLGVRND